MSYTAPAPKPKDIARDFDVKLRYANPGSRLDMATPSELEREIAEALAERLGVEVTVTEDLPF